MSQVPEELRSIVSQKTFSSILSFAVDHLTARKHPIIGKQKSWKKSTGQSFIKFDFSHQNGEITYTVPHSLVTRLNAAQY